jgi:hypothetical protein
VRRNRPTNSLNKEFAVSFRCINAFMFATSVYPNGLEVADDAAILRTHADHFAQVEQPTLGRSVEQAVAEPGGMRAVSKPKKALPKPGPKSEPSKEN